MPALFKQNSNVLKADFDIVYKNVTRKNECTYLDLYGFFDALEQLANKVFKGEQS